MARIPGAERPDEIVVLGNHHDAWTYGGVDPNSGTTALLEVARGLGTLLRQGWRPRRSLWLCAWDAEEQGLLGSTEWAEKHAAELQQKAVAYLNLDSSVAGDRFDASAVPSLRQFLREVADAVPDPRGGTVLEQATRRMREELRRGVVPGRVPDGVESAPIADRELKIDNLGSGSDYTAFLDHLGIPSTDFGFGGDYGVYHSIFDNHRWMKNFGDPGFRYHTAAARYYGLQALRLAEADLLPFDYEAYGSEIQKYLDGISKKVSLLGQQKELDFAPPRAAAARLASAGKEVREKYQWAVAAGLLVLSERSADPEPVPRLSLGTVSESRTVEGSEVEGRPQNLDQVNRALVEVEQAFLLPEGLPGRPWFKHAVFAPGTYTGYAAVPLPGVHESIDAGDFAEARRQLDLLTAAINRAATKLESCSAPR